jgi:hypothetical protein
MTEIFCPQPYPLPAEEEGEFFKRYLPLTPSSKKRGNLTCVIERYRREFSPDGVLGVSPNSINVPQRMGD